MKLAQMSMMALKAFSLFAFAATPVAWGGVVAGAKYNIKVRRSGLCMDVARESKEQGAGVMAWGCKPTTVSRTNQQFEFRSVGGGMYEIVAVHSGMCVAVPDFDGGDAGALLQVNCSDSAEKYFTLKASRNGNYSVLVSAKTGKCVEALTLGPQSGVVLLQSACSDGVQDKGVDQDFIIDAAR